jgi:hypothetical protein
MEGAKIGGFWKKYKKRAPGGRIVIKNDYICMIPKS